MNPGAALNVVHAAPAFAPSDSARDLRGYAHDLRNQLTVVVGTCDLLDCARTDPAKLERFIGNIRGAARRCSDIAAAMMAPDVQQARELPVVDLHQFLRDELGLVCGEYLRAGVTLSLETDARPPMVRIDALELARSLANLISNARDAMLFHKLFASPRFPRIIVRTETATDWRGVVLSVADNGPGIPDEMHAQIWRDGYSTKTPAPGSRRGFGLAVVRQCIERAGGRVGLESVPGEGSTFLLHLPLA